MGEFLMGPVVQRQLSDDLLEGLSRRRGQVTGQTPEEAAEEPGTPGAELDRRHGERLRSHLLHGLSKQRGRATGQTEQDASEEVGTPGQILDREQADDPRYQGAMSRIRQESLEVGAPPTRTEQRRRQVKNRRERQLGGAVTAKKKQFFEDEFLGSQAKARDDELA
ncbi:MAG: hypothetical protein ACRD2W_10405 [Acidimicrobiales bacterium]